MPNLLLKIASPGRPRHRSLLRVFAIAVLCLLAGCQADLYTKVAEADANEMLEALLAAGLDAQKQSPDGGKTWNIQVEQSQTVRALDVLRDKALPHERRATLGDLFKRDGMISSPTEERVRFLYGQEQELADTLSHIDGVIVARVHIVLPNNDPLANVTKPSSASIFVKYRRGTDIQALVPDIKNLVMHAVEGLDYSTVTVTPVPSADSSIRIEERRPAPPAGSGVASIIVGAIVLLLSAAGAAAFAWHKRWRPKRRTERAAEPAIAGQLVSDHGQPQ